MYRYTTYPLENKIPRLHYDSNLNEIKSKLESFIKSINAKIKASTVEINNLEDCTMIVEDGVSDLKKTIN